MRIPAGYGWAETATLPCAALTTWRALFVENELRAGDWVITQGSGGVSVFALQFAKAIGARAIELAGLEQPLPNAREHWR